MWSETYAGDTHSLHTGTCPHYSCFLMKRYTVDFSFRSSLIFLFAPLNKFMKITRCLLNLYTGWEKR